ncbi:hypothetical protein TNCT_65281 [Trichonephila clavata]|uniref:Uncharacterized protein n=1 Tax=Trichonephila clavata TaxID=2740835 RepID=A0A8X6LH65_TRICU|nr:hypothetical protein TNCT_65281 [Trichonephila clavata]
MSQLSYEYHFFKCRRTQKIISIVSRTIRTIFEDELIDEHNNAREAILAREHQLGQMHILKHIVQETDNEIAFNQPHAINLLETLEEIVQVELEDEATEQAMNK